MCSQEGLHDFQNEEYMVSYLGIAQLLLLLANLEYLSTVDKSHSSWGPSIFSLRRAIKKNCKLCVPEIQWTLITVWGEGSLDFECPRQGWLHSLLGSVLSENAESPFQKIGESTIVVLILKYKPLPLLWSLSTFHGV